MLADEILNPPIQYRLIWLLIGSLLLLLIGLWYAVVVWITRHKALKSLDDLDHLPTGKELEKLKAKYLKMIEALYQQYQEKEITLRELHHALSMAVRYFVYEAKHFPAPRLTLSDLMLSPYPELTKLIADYYPEEFAVITHGTAEHATEAAKGFITQWPS